MARLNKKTFDNPDIYIKCFTGSAEYDGAKSFCIRLDEDEYNEMRRDGWDAKKSQKQNDDGSFRYYMPVKVKFSPYPPTIWHTISYEGEPIEMSEMTEKDVGDLDDLEFVKCQVIITPSFPKDRRTGARADYAVAYLEYMNVTTETNPFEMERRQMLERLERRRRLEEANGVNAEDLPF